MLGGLGTELDSAAFILLQTMHRDSERGVKMNDCGCHPGCIMSAFSNTKARSDCTDAVSLCLRGTIIKKLKWSTQFFDMWALKSSLLNSELVPKVTGYLEAWEAFSICCLGWVFIGFVWF